MNRWVEKRTVFLFVVLGAPIGVEKMGVNMSYARNGFRTLENFIILPRSDLNWRPTNCSLANLLEFPNAAQLL